MDILVVALVAAFASGLTLFSGFGLGTILLPAFALFFPAPLAVAATGIVHLLNNLFKAILLWRRADWAMVLRFGLPAVPAAMLGAWALALLGETHRLFEWSLPGRSYGPTGAGLIVGLLMILFAALELHSGFQALRAPPRLVSLGGALSGFFGGLTGQQGALRSVFLLRAGLSAERFIATGVLIAVLVDLSRLATYGAAFLSAGLTLDGHALTLLLAGTLSAFAGAFFGARWVDKVSIRAVRLTVAALMFAIGAALAAGVLG